jgi:hypothetical protein
LQFHLFIVFNGQLLGIIVEFLELGFVTFKVYLEGFEELSTGWVLGGGGCVDEGVHVSGRLEFEVEFVAFGGEEAEFTFEFITTFDVGDVTALEGS